MKQVKIQAETITPTELTHDDYVIICKITGGNIKEIGLLIREHYNMGNYKFLCLSHSTTRGNSHRPAGGTESNISSIVTWALQVGFNVYQFPTAAECFAFVNDFFSTI